MRGRTLTLPKTEEVKPKRITVQDSRVTEGKVRQIA